MTTQTNIPQLSAKLTAKLNEENSEFEKWLDTFVEEKGFDTETVFEVKGKSGMNRIPLESLLVTMKGATRREKIGIRNTLVNKDVENGDCMRFFKHLAQCIAV